MKNKYVFVVVMLCVILVAGMGFTNLYVNYSEGDTSKEELTVVTSFYPMYVAAMNVVGDAPGVKLQNLSEPQTGCLHDFQLTPEDMKLLSTADVFIINGGGIEAFMEDVAKAYPNLTIVSTCEYLELLSDGDETNAHAWMSVGMYREMVQTIAMGLAKADPDNRALYEENAEIYDSKLMRLEERQQTVAEAAEGTDVILFHEAYDYVADDYGMQVTILTRYGLKNYAVCDRDFTFANGDKTDLRYSNVVVINRYYGVTSYDKKGKTRYRVKIHINGNYTVGTYSTEEKAAIAYNKAVDLARKAGIDRNFNENYVDSLTPSEYADLYLKVKISGKYMQYLEDYKNRKG